MLHRRAADYEGVNVAVLVVAPDATVSYANPVAHRMLGYALGSLRGRTLDSLMPDSCAADRAIVLSVFETGGSQRLQSQALRADGRLLDLSVTLEPTTKETDYVAGVAMICQPLPPWKSRSSSDAPSA